MKAAEIVDEFPSVSQTFVLAQLAGLASAGYDLRIFADSADAFAEAGMDSAARALMDRVKYFGLPLRKLRASTGKSGRADTRAPAKPEGSAGRAMKETARALRLKYESRAFAGESTFDVIHAHFGPNGTRAVKLRRNGIVMGPLITSFYGYDIGRQRVRETYADLFASGEKFIVLSNHMRATLLALGAPSDRIVVHRLGIDTDRFVPVARSGGRKLEIISIARLVEKKGIEYALRGVAELAGSKVPYRYTIVGEGPLRGALERLSRELGIADDIVFAGAQPSTEVLTRLQSSDVLLAPSVTAEDGDLEGTPVAIIEAQGCGLPVVATRHAGIPEIVSEGESGFLVPERDSQSIGASLAKLSESPSLRATMGSSGRAIVADKYNIKVLNAELVRIYERTMAEGLR